MRTAMIESATPGGEMGSRSDKSPIELMLKSDAHSDQFTFHKDIKCINFHVNSSTPVGWMQGCGGGGGGSQCLQSVSLH